MRWGKSRHAKESTDTVILYDVGHSVSAMIGLLARRERVGDAFVVGPHRFFWGATATDQGRAVRRIRPHFSTSSRHSRNVM